uniref:Selenoprotein K n=1 Tax=Papio anubis TaxID=9555 RepID=A0A2I3LQU7_PAPAN
MVYISNGQVLDSQSQSPWRLSLITDFFWGIAEFEVLFFKTLLQQDVKKRSYGNSSDSRYNDGRGPPGNPPQRMGKS